MVAVATMVEAAGTTVMVPLRVMATAANINQKRKAPFGRFFVFSQVWAESIVD
ncbi:hypothetical protein [Brevibacillus centrosporus]|uniref:hypothetical protein n=1 Tax=Brevibacillus centrosporus TaxID=54910 RepID=UPI001476A364|nr:hypothetical protein [Brevibacillus centrosporus]MED4909689.1 hypothetical protein [Brevibacillus centrosporus]